MKPSNVSDYLLQLRLVVAHHGEMDRAGWWNTRVLSRQGKVVLGRGFPRTQSLARARIAFSVARARCRDILTKSDAWSLWSLPAQLEDQFEERWFEWLEQDSSHAEIIQRLEEDDSESLVSSLETFNLINQGHVDALKTLKINEGHRIVEVSKGEKISADVLALLAAGFALGKQARLVVPYAQK